jgi:hypothetical protein
MAQTKRKRQTKHRGNAAGVVESRGRTGRKPTVAEKSGNPSEVAKAKREKLIDKRDRPPTWRNAFIRAMFAAILMLLIVIVLFNRSKQGIAFFPIVLLLYWPISYYSDKWVFDRRQRKKAKGAGGSAAAR